MASVEDELIQVAYIDRLFSGTAASVQDIGDLFTRVPVVAGGLDGLLGNATSARQRWGGEFQPGAADGRLGGDVRVSDAFDRIAAADSGGAIGVLDRAGISGADLMEPGPRFTTGQEPASSVMASVQGGVFNDLLTSRESPAGGLPAALRAVTDGRASVAPVGPYDVPHNVQPIGSSSSRFPSGDEAADAPGFQVRRGRGGRAMQQIMDGLMELVEVHSGSQSRSAYVNGILPTR